MFKHIFNFWFMPLMGMFFAAGATAVADGGGADAAVADAGANAGADSADDSSGADADAGADTSDADADAVASDDTPDDTDGQAAAGKDTKPAQKILEGDGRQMPAKLRAAIAEAKKTDPQLAAQLKDIYWGYFNQKNEIAKHFPGGIAEAVKLKETVDDLVGQDGLEELTGELGEYRSLDQQFIEGNPEFIRAAVEKFPDGFKKLMPSMIDTWSDVDPESYERRMAGIIVGTLRQAQADDQGNALGTFAGNEERAVDYLQMLQTTPEQKSIIDKVVALLGINQRLLNGWTNLANSKPRAPTVNPDQQRIDRERTELNQREAKMFTDGVGRDFNSFSHPKIDAELTKLLNGRPITDASKNIFYNKVKNRILLNLRSQPGFESKYDSLCDNKDHAGAIKMLTSRGGPLLADAVDKTYRELYGEPKLGAKKNPPAAGDKNKPGANPPGSKEKPVAGWTKVTEPPKTDEMDLKASPFEMRIKKQAILKSGKKVYWGDKIPS
jgi:G:T/U-mismatch repair DNA glycosylase